MKLKPTPLFFITSLFWGCLFFLTDLSAQTPMVDFSYEIRGNQVYFTPNCNPDQGKCAWKRYQFMWDFGDCQYSFEPEPIHSFETAGTYEVKLIVSNIYDDVLEDEAESPGEVRSMGEVIYDTLIHSLIISPEVVESGPEAKLEKVLSDIETGFTESCPPRPGFYIWYWIEYQNNSSEPQALSLRLTLDAALENVPQAEGSAFTLIGEGFAEDPIYTAESHSFLMSLGEVQPGTGCGGLLKMLVAEGTDTASILKCELEALDAGGEVVYTTLYTSPVVTSWDPNKIKVTPRRRIRAGDTLTYTIFFENYGDAPAINIVIKDTLPKAVIPESFKILARHPLSIGAPLQTGRIITWSGPVMLAPVNPKVKGRNQGMVKYQVVTRSDLTPGTAIGNRAAIKFDNNPPILTRPVLNVVVPDCSDSPSSSPPSTQFPYHWLALVLGGLLVVSWVFFAVKRKG